MHPHILRAHSGKHSGTPDSPHRLWRRLCSVARCFLRIRALSSRRPAASTSFGSCPCNHGKHTTSALSSRGHPSPSYHSQPRQGAPCTQCGLSDTHAKKKKVRSRNFVFRRSSLRLLRTSNCARPSVLTLTLTNMAANGGMKHGIWASVGNPMCCQLKIS